MSNRFGLTGTFFYKPGDTFSGTTGGTFLPLFTEEMPQYPFESFTETDRTTLTSLSGRRWSFQNYKLEAYKFNWSNCSQSLRDRLKAMHDSDPVLTFNTGGTLWGTFRLMDDTWQDSEVGFDLFDLGFTIIENV